MEGVVDQVMRDLLTRDGAFDLCVTEFVRVTTTLFPASVFHRNCPELNAGGRTPSGTPVFVQLLGADPALMAANACRAVDLGAPGIDLNFGCPAKTVNRHQGGAVLLKQPERLYAITAAVRSAVPARVPVTAKMRLGFDHTDLALDNAAALAAAGARWITVHARTRSDAYRPPAHWDWIPRLQAAVPVPVTANGDIWSRADFERCRAVTGAGAYMLGRGAIARPDLARQIRSMSAGNAIPALVWADLPPLLLALFHGTARSTMRARPGARAAARVKQWLRYLAGSYPEAAALFREVKTMRDPNALVTAVSGQPASSVDMPMENDTANTATGRDGALSSLSGRL
jgi:tRNA-dihydrouridine synthase C